MVFWKKKDKKPKKDMNPQEVHNNRIEIEDMLEQGFRCSEIAEELGIEADFVYRVKTNMRARQIKANARAKEIKQDNKDDVAEIKKEMALLELEMKKRDLEWEKEDREKEREDDLKEDLKEVAGDDMPWWAPLVMGFVNKNKNPQIPAACSTTPTPQTVSEAKPQPAALSEDEQITNIMRLIPEDQIKKIKNGSYSYGQCIAYAKLNGIPEDQADKVYNKIIESEKDD
jgi:hypothetical protein